MNEAPTGTPRTPLTINVDSATYRQQRDLRRADGALGKDINGGLFVGTNSSIANTDGMRNDIIQGFKDAGVGMIEWPGGCAANSYNLTPTESGQ